MPRYLHHLCAASLAICLLVLSALVYPQTVAHAAHHAHHQTTMHATVLCAWLCAAGQALDSADVGFHAQVGPSVVVFLKLPEEHLLTAARCSCSRAPPTSLS